MEKAEVMSFGKPVEIRNFPKGHLELIKTGGATVGRAFFDILIKRSCQNI